MSYILDALRRADAERERGGVPSLHAQPVPLLSGDADSERRGPAPGVWMVAGAALVVAAFAAWQFAGDETVPAAPVTARDAAVSAAPPPPAPATPPTTVAAAPPATLPQADALPATRPDAAATKPLPPAKASADTAPRRPATAPAPARRAPTAPGADAPAAPSTPADARIHAIHELPDDVRRDLPKLAIGGSVYSEQPTERMLIVNGQVAREKDRLGPELVLEQIRLKSAVLRFRGYRYELAY